MSFADDNPRYRITTEEQARAWVMELVDGVELARNACDEQATTEKQRKLYTTWLTRHGAALGSITALHRCGRLGDVAYEELRQRVMRTMNPTIITATATPGGKRGRR